MRSLYWLLMIGAVTLAQEAPLRTTSRLVLAPVSVTTRDGKPVEGLTEQDLTVFDNNVPVKIHMEDVTQPLSLTIVVQTTRSAQSMLDKLRKTTSLFGPFLTGDRGEASVIAFGSEVRVAQEFTRNPDRIEMALRALDGKGDGGSLVDALSSALRLLEKRSKDRRRVILVLSEKHDRSSEESLQSLVALAERVNATLYGVTFSPTATAFAKRAPKYCDRKCRNCARTCGNCGNHCDREKPDRVPSDQPGPMNLLAIFGELKRMSQPDVPAALARLSGGEAGGFVRKQGLEEVLQRIGADLHRQYLITFPMSRVQPGSFHPIRVHVNGRPQLVVRTRSGYLEPAGE